LPACSLLGKTRPGDNRNGNQRTDQSQHDHCERHARPKTGVASDKIGDAAQKQRKQNPAEDKK
jgi:hypothetical protein